MSEIGSGGYHWQDERHTTRWSEIRKTLDPDRAEGFSQLLDKLPRDRSTAMRVLDLGAGDGKVASVVLDEFPRAHAVLVDFSEPMIAMGVNQLASFADRFSYCRWNMNEGDWPAELQGPFEAVVSSAAIHHLENDRKAWLARQIFEHLAPAGVFANFDLFRDPAATFGPDEIHDRTCATLNEATDFLVEAGFADIVVGARLPRPKRKGELALLTARKPAR